jgi:hypothetical protein
MRDIVLHNGQTTNLEALGLKPKKSLKDMLHGVTVQEKLDKVLVVLLDGSGSMWEIFGPDSKINMAWKILRSELMPNLTGWNYGVLLFHGDQDCDWMIYPYNMKAGLTITAPMADGSTPMMEGLNTSWRWVKEHASNARFIMLSDGEPTDSSKDEILDMAKLNKTIPIDTVGIGTRSSYGGYDPTFLRKLSEITGGMFVEAYSVKVLSDTILTLAPSNRPLLGPVHGVK